MVDTKKNKTKLALKSGGKAEAKLGAKLGAKSGVKSGVNSGANLGVNSGAKPDSTDSVANGNGDSKGNSKGNGKLSKTQSKQELAAQQESAHNSQLQASAEVSALLARLQVLAQYLKDLSFESPNAPQIFTPQQQGQTPQFSLDIRVKANKLAPERHEVVIMLKVAMTRGEQACFLAEIIYAGLVAVPEPAPADSLLQALLLIEVPRLLFPYARNILSEITQSSGFPPLVVQPIDFAALYRKQLAEARASLSQGGES